MSGARAAAKDRLHETGLEGRATIASLSQTGMWMNGSLPLRVDPNRPSHFVVDWEKA